MFLHTMYMHWCVYEYKIYVCVCMNYTTCRDNAPFPNHRLCLKTLMPDMRNLRVREVQETPK